MLLIYIYVRELVHRPIYAGTGTGCVRVYEIAAACCCCNGMGCKNIMRVNGDGRPGGLLICIIVVSSYYTTAALLL